MKRWVLFIILLVIFLVIGGSIDATTFRNPIRAANFTELLYLLINFLWVLSVALLPLAIMMSAFYFLIGGGDEKKITAAKDILLYAFMGFIIITAARGLIPMIIDVLTI